MLLTTRKKAMAVLVLGAVGVIALITSPFVRNTLAQEQKKQGQHIQEAVKQRIQEAVKQPTQKQGEKPANDAPAKSTTSGQREVPDAARNISNVQRLATALHDFNLQPNAANSITIWLQKGVSTAKDSNTLDLTKAIASCSDQWEKFDLENVAILRASGRTIQFVNVKDKVAFGKPSGLTVNRGDLVVVLKAPNMPPAAPLPPGPPPPQAAPPGLRGPKGGENRRSPSP